MRTKNFPARKLARQLRADERRNPNAYDTQSELGLLRDARGKRSKVVRKAKS